MIDSEIGESATLRLSPKADVLVARVRSLPAPVAAAHVAGPTGAGCR